MKEAILEKMAGEITLSEAAGPTMRKWRETFGFSQSDLAARLDINPSLVSDSQSGRRKSPGIAPVRRMCNALVEMDEARGGHIIARFHSLQNPTEGILSIGEYRRNRKSTRLNSSHGYTSYAVFS